MKYKYGIVGVLVCAVLTLPFAAIADPGKKEGGHGHYSKHEGKNKNSGKHKHKKKNDYEYADEHKHTAGGPPPWAPAHGWRRKHGSERYDYEHEHERPLVTESDGTYVRVSDGSASVDVGIDMGTCNRKAIGTVIGGVIGGAIGNHVSSKKDRKDRNVATVLGAVVGGIVGHEVGSSMDNADQHCTGQVLEQANDHQTVRWADHNNTGHYSVTPLRTYQINGIDCRDFITEYQGPNGNERERSSACRNSDGAWSQKNIM